MNYKECPSLELIRLDNLKWYVCKNVTPAFLPDGRAVDVKKKPPKWCPERPVPVKVSRRYYIKKSDRGEI